ncbi:MAG: diguanylate cyclase [Desulfobacterales bacterium]|nr:diguanylate cyclase [Desulfobacterales bacterium]
MPDSTHKWICPISGLTVRRMPEWTDVAFEDNFKLSADIIGEHILLTHNYGSATLEGARRAFDFTARLIRMHLPNRPYVHVLDYTELKSATLESRRFFIREMKARTNLKGLVLFGLTPLMRVSVKLGRRLNMVDFQVQIAKDYGHAICLAQELLASADSRSETSASGAEARPEVVLTRGGANLPVVRRDEWVMETPDFKIAFEIVAGRIIHSVSSGYLRVIHLPGLIALRDEVVASMRPLGPPGYIVANMTGITGYERRARRHYVENISAWHRQTPLRGFIPYGLSPLMAAAVNLSKFLLPFKVYVARSLEDALDFIDGNDSRLAAAAPPAQKSSGASYTLAAEQDSVEGLLAYIGSIDWEISGMVEGVPDRVDSSLLPVYDAIRLIKSEIDDLIHEKARVEQALKDARSELETRVRERTSELVETNRALNREIGERREIEQALRASEKNYRDLVDSVNSIILRWDCRGRVIFMNPYGLFFFGYRPEEIYGRSVVGTIVPETESMTKRNLSERLQAIQRDPDRFRINENENMKKDGTRVWVYWNNRPVKDRDGRIVEILSVGTDITERRHMEAKLRLLATTDPLTGAFNRRQFYDKARSEFQRHRRYGHSFVLLLMDLDHFKRINDTYGHPAGDAALKSFVNTANMIFRETDLFGRTGGEEFSALLPETEIEDAVKVANRLREKIDALQLIAEGNTIHYTVSIGLAALRREDESLREMVRRADRALYEAKGTGRNRVVTR